MFTRWVTPRGPASAERGAVNLPVVIGGCLVTPGDLVIGDDDGLVALSPAAIRGRIGDAEAKLAREAEWEASLAGGRSVLETFGLTAPARKRQAGPRGRLDAQDGAGVRRGSRLAGACKRLLCSIEQHGAPRARRYDRPDHRRGSGHGCASHHRPSEPERQCRGGAGRPAAR